MWQEAKLSKLIIFGGWSKLIKNVKKKYRPRVEYFGLRKSCCDLFVCCYVMLCCVLGGWGAGGGDVVGTTNDVKYASETWHTCDRHVTIYALTTMHACLNACCIYYSILIFISIMMLKHFTLCTKISTGIIYPLVPRFLQALSKSWLKTNIWENWLLGMVELLS